MSEEQGNDIGAFLAGFIIGGLVGAAAALILAPQSGEQTRSQLASQSAHLRETGSERIHDYRDRAEHYTADARQAAQEQVARVQEQTRIILDRGSSHQEDAPENGAGDGTEAANGQSGSEAATDQNGDSQSATDDAGDAA